MTRCDYKKPGCSNDGLVIGVEWMCVKHIASQRALIEQQAKEIERLREALRELHAVVKGECASLLNEDSGGDAELAIEIEALLKEEHP